MLNRTKVLITGTGSCGVGEGIFKCLMMENSIQDIYEIHAANSDVASVSIHEAFKGHILPMAKDSKYIDSIVKLCSTEGVEFVIPGSEPELVVLSENRKQLESIGVTVLCNSKEAITIGADKMLTADFLLRHGLCTPKSYPDLSDASVENLNFPFIAKPKSGHASKNVFVVNDKKHLKLIRDFYSYYQIDGMAQELVGDDNSEYTASSLMDMNGELIGSIASRRTLIGGATGYVEINDFPEIRATVEHISNLLNATGPVNIQCRIHKGKVFVFEINPRFSGSAPFRALAGFNEPHLLIQSIFSKISKNSHKIKNGMYGVRGFCEILYKDDENLSVFR